MIMLASPGHGDGKVVVTPKHNISVIKAPPPRFHEKTMQCSPCVPQPEADCDIRVQAAQTATPHSCRLAFPLSWHAQKRFRSECVRGHTFSAL